MSFGLMSKFATETSNSAAILSLTTFSLTTPCYHSQHNCTQYCVLLCRVSPFFFVMLSVIQLRVVRRSVVAPSKLLFVFSRQTLNLIFFFSFLRVWNPGRDGCSVSTFFDIYQTRQTQSLTHSIRKQRRVCSLPHFWSKIFRENEQGIQTAPRDHRYSLES